MADQFPAEHRNQSSLLDRPLARFTCLLLAVYLPVAYAELFLPYYPFGEFSIPDLLSLPLWLCSCLILERDSLALPGFIIICCGLAVLARIRRRVLFWSAAVLCAIWSWITCEMMLFAARS